jgi:hypothetical protein
VDAQSQPKGERASGLEIKRTSFTTETVVRLIREMWINDASTSSLAELSIRMEEWFRKSRDLNE